MKSVVHFYKKRIGKIEEILDLKARDITDETIHQLRVEIKKIRAAFKLVAGVRKGFDDESYFKPFDRLFRKAGKLRTIQVDKKLLALKGTTMSESSESKARDKFLNAVRSERKKRSIAHQNKKLLTILGKVSAKDIRKQLSNDLEELRNLFHNALFKEEQLHVVRKKLKRFFLLAKKILSKRAVKHLDAFLELLGKWHDRREAFLHVMKFAFTSPAAANQTNRLNRIKSKLLRDKETLFNRIVSEGLSNRWFRYIVVD